MVVTGRGVAVATPCGVLHAHLSTAEIRLRSLRSGGSDPLVRAAGIRRGDTIIDCTFGLGRDAAVASFAVGDKGRVIGIESSRPLALLGQAEPLPVAEAAPVVVHHADAVAWLTAAEPDSADVVVIDPMFERPVTSDATFTLLRALADPTPISADWVEAARRVARRVVVVKSSSHLPWFDDAGLKALPGHGEARWFTATPPGP